MPIILNIQRSPCDSYGSQRQMFCRLGRTLLKGKGIEFRAGSLLCSGQALVKVTFSIASSRKSIRWFVRSTTKEVTRSLTAKQKLSPSAAEQVKSMYLIDKTVPLSSSNKNCRGRSFCRPKLALEFQFKATAVTEF